jgi:hypothetical protein
MNNYNNIFHDGSDNIELILYMLILPPFFNTRTLPKMKFSSTQGHYLFKRRIN